MKRLDIIREVTRRSGVIISNIGFPSRELYSIQDREEYFYMLGSMGMASSIGLGIAISSTEQVYVIDGDGSLLMNFGSLVTIANQAPDNLCIIIVDNHAYGSTGNQPTYTAAKTDLAGMAAAAGCEHVKKVRSIGALSSALEACCGLCSVIVAEAEPGNERSGVIPHDADFIKTRFMNCLLKKGLKDVRL